MARTHLVPGGKPIIYSKAQFVKKYGQESWRLQPLENQVVKNGESIAVRIENRLKFDVEYYSKILLNETEKDIGKYYPPDEKNNKPVAYYWARVGTCSNPSCKAKVPLLRQMNLANKADKKVYLKPKISGNKIEFELKKGGLSDESWISRGNLLCPCCGNTTENSVLKQQFLDGKIEDRLLVLIFDGKQGKEYRLPSEIDLNPLKKYLIFFHNCFSYYHCFNFTEKKSTFSL